MQNEPLPTDIIIFKQHKTYTPQEILAAGGATIFGHRLGKSNKELMIAIQTAPVSEPFSEEEWHKTLAQMKNQ